MIKQHFNRQFNSFRIGYSKFLCLWFKIAKNIEIPRSSLILPIFHRKRIFKHDCKGNRPKEFLKVLWRCATPRWILDSLHSGKAHLLYIVMIQETSYFGTKTNILRFEYWVDPDITFFYSFFRKQIRILFA